MAKTIDEYVQQMRADSYRWFDYDGNELPAWILGLCGESGEVADLYKKHLRGTKTHEEFEIRLAEELIDVFHYWCLLIGFFEIDVEEVYRKKREHNERRFNKS